MLSPENELPRDQFVKDIFNGIADWVGKYRQKFGLGSQFGLCTPDDVVAADLVLKMLVALRVDPKALENTDPHVMRDLQRLCTTCGAKKRCKHELADGTAGDHFREFCPNAFTLEALLIRTSQS